MSPTYDITNTTLLPPDHPALQYHFALGQFDPCLGIGADYTSFLGTTSPLTRKLGYGNAVNVRRRRPGAAGGHRITT